MLLKNMLIFFLDQGGEVPKKKAKIINIYGPPKNSKKSVAMHFAYLSIVKRIFTDYKAIPFTRKK